MEHTNPNSPAPLSASAVSPTSQPLDVQTMPVSSRYDDNFYRTVVANISKTIQCGSDHGNRMISGLAVTVLFRMCYDRSQGSLKYLIIDRIGEWTGLSRLNASKIAYLSFKIVNNRENPAYIKAIGDWAKGIEVKASFLSEATRIALWWKSSFPKKFSFYQLQMIAAEIEQSKKRTNDEPILLTGASSSQSNLDDGESEDYGHGPSSPGDVNDLLLAASAMSNPDLTRKRHADWEPSVDGTSANDATTINSSHGHAKPKSPVAKTAPNPLHQLVDQAMAMTPASKMAAPSSGRFTKPPAAAASSVGMHAIPPLSMPHNLQSSSMRPPVQIRSSSVPPIPVGAPSPILQYMSDVNASRSMPAAMMPLPPRPPPFGSRQMSHPQLYGYPPRPMMPPFPLPPVMDPTKTLFPPRPILTPAANTQEPEPTSNGDEDQGSKVMRIRNLIHES